MLLPAGMPMAIAVPMITLDTNSAYKFGETIKILIEKEERSVAEISAFLLPMR